MKKDIAWLVVFACFIIFIFLLEGLGVPGGRLLTFHLILTMPFCLFSLDVISGNRLGIPAKSVSLFLVYLIFVAISVLFGVSAENSFGALFYLVSLLLIFISVFNHKNFEEILMPLIIILSYSFVGYTIFLQLMPDTFSYLIPENGYQFVYSKFGSHNHLGDFLVLGIIIALYKYIAKKSSFYLVTILLFSIFLLTSFSRSAYMTFIISAGFLVWSAWRHKKIKAGSFPVIYVLGAIVISLVFFFAVVSEARSLPVLKDINSYIGNKLDLKPKTFLARRGDFAGFAIGSLKNNPLIGVGLGNFITLATPDVSNPYRLRPLSSHNIFEDIFSESGIFALGSFFIFIVCIFYGASKKRELVFFLVVSMLVNFQTDYTHTIYSFFVLFFILLGCLNKDKMIISTSLTRLVFIISGLTFVLGWFLRH